MPVKCIDPMATPNTAPPSIGDLRTMTIVKPTMVMTIAIAMESVVSPISYPSCSEG